MDEDAKSRAPRAAEGDDLRQQVDGMHVDFDCWVSCRVPMLFDPPPQLRCN